MDNGIKFSIISPVFNTREDYLRESLDSLLAQDYKNFEVLVIDDCSNKETKDILEEYRLKSENIKIIHHEVNKGLCAGRITGISNATGDYVMFVDSDDDIPVDALSSLNNILKTKDYDTIIYSMIRFVRTLDNTLELPSFFKDGELTKQIVLTELSKLHLNSVCNKCVKLDILKKAYSNLSKDYVMGEDLQQSTNIVIESNSFYFLDKILYYYRVNETNRSYYSYAKLDDMNFMVPTYKRLFVDNNFEEYLSFFKLAAVNSIMYRAFKLCKLDNKKELLDKLNEIEIVQIVKGIDKKIPFASQIVFDFIVHKNYFLLNICAKIYNRLVKEY